MLERIMSSAENWEDTAYHEYCQAFQTKEKMVPTKLYKYVSLSNAGADGGEESKKTKLDTMKLCSLYNNKMYVSPPRDFNDPFDCRGFVLLSNRASREKTNNHYSDLVLASSLTECGYCSMPMWGNYANNHNGYCIEYDMTDACNSNIRMNMFPVQYVEEKVDLSPLGELIAERRGRKYPIDDPRSRSLSLVLQLAIHIKQKDWSNEKEWRYTENVYREVFRGIESRGRGVDASPSAIYVGCRCSLDSFAGKRLIEIGVEKGVPVYQMEPDQSDPQFQMKAIKIID